ncbi:MAG TPA: PHP domain-containing protein [Victivallales bacterium]|nr:PHP domain-containing protein [Victivallales bacterium]
MYYPKVDYHIHTKYLGCGRPEMEIEAIVRTCEKLGLEALAITDHLNTFDKAPLHKPILEDLKKIDTDIKLYFAVELNFRGCNQGFAYNRQIAEDIGFQFAIGGPHSPFTRNKDLNEIIDIHHAHHLKTCHDQFVKVLVHPYWFPKDIFDKYRLPWFDTMAKVPEEYTRELGHVAKSTGTAIEINGTAILEGEDLGAPSYYKDCIEYYRILKEEGVKFTVSSDAHLLKQLGMVKTAWDIAAELDLTPEDFWHPDGKTIN